ncbi:hypothetical protein CR513_27668, partial [Mucuna pruriens]
MDIDRSFNSPTSPLICKKRSNQEWCRGSGFLSIFDIAKGRTGLNGTEKCFRSSSYLSRATKIVQFGERLKVQRCNQGFIEELSILARSCHPTKRLSKKWNNYTVPIRKNLLKLDYDSIKKEPIEASSLMNSRQHAGGGGGGRRPRKWDSIPIGTKLGAPWPKTLSWPKRKLSRPDKFLPSRAQLHNLSHSKQNANSRNVLAQNICLGPEGTIPAKLVPSQPSPTQRPKSLQQECVSHDKACVARNKAHFILYLTLRSSNPNLFIYAFGLSPSQFNFSPSLVTQSETDEEIRASVSMERFMGEIGDSEVSKGLDRGVSKRVTILSSSMGLDGVVYGWMEDKGLAMPSSSSFVGSMSTASRVRCMGDVGVGRNVLTLIKSEQVFALIQPSMPKKYNDLGTFPIPCTIGKCSFDAMLDLGATINVMPSSVYISFKLGASESTGIVIQLVNRSIAYPLGILEDVLVQVRDVIFPTDFYVLDMKDELSNKGPTLILAKPFLKTVRTKIDVHAGTLFMEFGDNKVECTIFEAMKHPTKNHSVFYLDLIEVKEVRPKLRMSRPNQERFDLIEASQPTRSSSGQTNLPAKVDFRGTRLGFGKLEVVEGDRSVLPKHSDGQKPQRMAITGAPLPSFH